MIWKLLENVLEQLTRNRGNKFQMFLLQCLVVPNLLSLEYLLANTIQELWISLELYSKASESLEFDYNVKIQDSRQRHTGSEDIITKLAYARALKQLEETIPKFTSRTSRKDRNEVLKRKEQILQIATREGIPSKYTYFATVDLETGIEVKGHWTRQTRFTSSTGDSPTSSHATSWNSRIPYGSIARNKLSSIRKLSAPDAPAAKIARIIETSDMIDLTEEQEA